MIQIKNKLRLAWQKTAGFFSMIGLWLKNFYYVFLSDNSRIRVFEGWHHWWFAKRYADKRYKISQINKYCGGKRHYVLPAGDYALAVVSSLEIQNLKKRGFYKGLDIKKILEQAYYVTK